MRIITKLVLISLLMLLMACDPRYGFIESKFKLSTDSKLPKFIQIRNNVETNKLLVTITIYSNPISGKARVQIYTTSPGYKIIYDKVGSFRWHPLTEERLKNSDKFGIYPQYMIIKINNIEEIFEQKKKGDILYVADKPQ